MNTRCSKSESAVLVTDCFDPKNLDSLLPATKLASLADSSVGISSVNPGSAVKTRPPWQNRDQSISGSSTTWSYPYAVTSSQPSLAASTSESRTKKLDGSCISAVAGSINSVGHPARRVTRAASHLSVVRVTVTSSTNATESTPAAFAAFATFAEYVITKTFVRSFSLTTPFLSRLSNASSSAESSPTVINTSSEAETSMDASAAQTAWAIDPIVSSPESPESLPHSPPVPFFTICSVD